MITKRIIPCLDIDNGRVVKGTNFVDIKDAGDPVECAKRYQTQGADELVFLDITASSDKRAILKDIVQAVAKEIFIPFTVGGGIRDIAMMQEILNLGADKISLNTAALHRPELIQEASNHFGSQCVVLAVDVKQTSPGKWEVFSHGGRKNLGIDALEWLTFCESSGAGEILLTSMDKDGTKDGYDLDILTLAKNRLTIPVIASGGAGNCDHISDALAVCDAALLASLLHFNHLTIPDIKTHLSHHQIPTR